MMRQYELVERVTKYDPDADEDLLNRAYVYAMKAHGNQKRASGEAYFNHPLEVAAILTEMKLDSATIAAALLHDTVEDTEATHQEIEEKFGPEIAVLVDGLTKIAKLDLVTKEAAQAENLRKLLLAMSQDVRVLLVKLADRLHNMRTLEHVKPEKRVRIAQETMDIYAPLAGRMGMQAVRDELEDIAFQVLNPDANKIILDRLAKLHAESRRHPEVDRAGADAEARRERHQGGGLRAREAALFDLPQDGAEAPVAGPALRHLRLPRHRRHGGPVLPGARHRPPHLPGGARPLQGLHLDAEAERLPLDPHHRHRPAPHARRNADPHPADA